ncbi:MULTISPECIES: carboxymuconolactone decarboxylase family protein [Priestia]|uniref:carboxymuconolactone decarboxylase family protein n=1 Tax=Priestia TaxID=2800373 RepID=UPI000D510020|nr:MULTISPECIES: carboxymuconolactone decarboxylase family protein [Priestia]MCM3796905.1 carboxymuconolactone decarboxylase family protein [Priestia megaterium]PVE64384.1 carboxymuconolactone decarboxylase family protein [Priestia megaterium]PVE79950.1 carboxymuconolactone decarboxylase family protein [Priestia megaterium]PVE83740.1 carboxymuconolactone decarboxylase family protein [Priestia megaterium]PVE99464.1 carboxymuconolactone decarboxylase family protein [Priestia megaterium]
MLALNQKLNSCFDTFFTEAVEGGTLPEREKVVAILTSATLLNDQDTLKNAVLTAKQLGFTKEEIGQITGIAIAVNAQKLRDQVEVRVESKPSSTCCQ